jgi:hypothetical protein
VRDVLIGRFLEEDLVRMDGGKIRPTTFLEFVEALHARKELPQPPSDWAVAGKQRKPATRGIRRPQKARALADKDAQRTGDSTV